LSNLMLISCHAAVAQYFFQDRFQVIQRKARLFYVVV